VLTSRGFVTPQPHKRPRNSYVRFEAALPNECWQADITHFCLRTGEEVEVLNMIDDHSRLCVSAVARMTFTTAHVLQSLHEAASSWGYPASVLTDNGAVFNARSRKGRTVFESELETLGILYKHARPYHPQTCGKVERFHQTMKKFLLKQRQAGSLRSLQAQIDRFVDHYNTARPHRARSRLTPSEAFSARDRAHPGSPVSATHFRLRTDRVDNEGHVTLRHDSRLLHIGVGRRHNGARVHLYVADLDVRIVTLEGELLRHLELDPSKTYQGRDREVD
jgi:transposase InsO family protein